MSVAINHFDCMRKLFANAAQKLHKSIFLRAYYGIRATDVNVDKAHI